jgi:hypothetical protein
MAVATGTALAIGAGAGLVGSSMQARAARKAADTQAAALTVRWLKNARCTTSLAKTWPHTENLDTPPLGTSSV